MNPWLLSLAMLAGVIAAALFYVASPQQQWREAGPWPARGRWFPAGLCALLSLLLMTRTLAPMEGVFAWSVLLMLACSLAPFIGAWWRCAAGRAP